MGSTPGQSNDQEQHTGTAVRERYLAFVRQMQEQSFPAEELRPCDYQRWRDLRAHLQQCEETRRRQFRFRKDPASYLAALEAQLLM